MSNPNQTIERCIILGGGGHARVVIDALQLSGNAAIHGVLDADPARWGTTILDVPILGGDDRLESLAATVVTHFVVGLGTVRHSDLRRKLYEHGIESGLKPLTVIHSSAFCSRWAAIGSGSVVLAMAVVNAGAAVGVNTIVNSGAIVEHDCVIGDHVHVASGARLAGGSRVGSGALIGAGAILRQEVSIGAEAIVGAGAVVLRDVPAGVIVAGNPARLISGKDEP